jgi:sugar O-acyltransferase (sialic acid O-acetyltransferase NeuD family)
MSQYRAAEGGVELIEPGRSTFLREDATTRAWREFLAWRAAGGELQPALPHPYSLSGGHTQPLPRLIIAGAGGYGREVFSMTATARSAREAWEVAGFLSDVPDVLDPFPGHPPILGGTDFQPLPGDLFVCAIGDIAGRKAVAERLRKRGAHFANLLQPHSLIAPSVLLGEGIIVESFAGIGANSRIGDFCTILAHTNLGHDVTLEPFVQVSPFACILGHVQVGEEVLIGSHAVILPGVKIGARATIGAGSVVLQNVREGETVFGVPAARLK